MGAPALTRKPDMGNANEGSRANEHTDRAQARHTNRLRPRRAEITPQMKEVAEREHRDPEYIRERVADGRIAIPANIVHINKGMRAFGVGEGLATKVNVNLGISGATRPMPPRSGRRSRSPRTTAPTPSWTSPTRARRASSASSSSTRRRSWWARCPCTTPCGYMEKPLRQAYQGRPARGRARTRRGRRGLYDHPLRHQQIGHQDL